MYNMRCSEYDDMPEYESDYTKARPNRFADDWKEHLRQNVAAVRAEVSRRGGVSSKDIDDAIKKYRTAN